MQTLSKMFSRRFPFPAKRSGGLDLSIIRRFIKASDSANLGELRGFRWNVRSGLVVIADHKLFVSIFLGIALYFLGAFLANEWLYLLCAGLWVGATLGLILPVLIVNAVVVECWVQEKALASEQSEIAVSIGKSKLFGPLSALLPVCLLSARINLLRRSANGYSMVPTVSEQSILLESVGRQATLKFTVPHLERGVYTVSHVEVMTSFPFGMAWWIRCVEPRRDIGNNKIVVYPRASSMSSNFLLQLQGDLSSMGLAFSNALAFTQSTSVRGIREFRRGDSLRHIHWPSSARTNKLFVREFDSETLPMFDLFFDLAANWTDKNQFELAVCIINSLIHFGYEHDMLPELYFNPPLDSEYFEHLMEDLPDLQAPLEMLSEILARLEPISAAPKKRFSDDERSDFKRQMLSVAPATEMVLKGSTPASAMSIRPVSLIAMTQSSVTPDSGNVVATINAEVELQTL